MDEEDQRVNAWYALCEHPFFEDCFRTNNTLLKEMLEKLTRTHDSIVIDRNDLPTVARRETDGFLTVEVDGFTRSWGDYWDAARFEREARSMLAMAEHLRKSPPVDEEAVEALVKTLRVSGVVGPRGVALALLADGWKREVTP